MRRHSITVQLGLVALLLVAGTPAFAQNFALQVGPPVAGNSKDTKTKSAILVVRPGGCADPAHAQISGTAEGLVDGSRRTIPLRLQALATPGVHAVAREFPNIGAWVVNLVGTCAGKSAGALVAIPANSSFRRDGVTLLAHAATPAEIDASLKAITTGGQR